MAIGAAGMYVVPVVLPSVQQEFGVARADAALPYTLQMIGFGLGGILMGRLADRFGITVPLVLGSVCLGLGFLLASLSSNILMFIAVHGIFVGMLGASCTFAPLIADTSLWFVRRRGIAVAVCASGNYLGGAIWPPIVQHFVADVGWRTTYMGLAAFCTISMFALALFMRRRPPNAVGTPMASGHGAPGSRPFGFSPRNAQGLLCLAALGCCVAMSMPQVHIVAYCTDLGFGAARGAEMLSLMLGFGIVSRLISGAICDRIGGLRTLLLGSALQTLALVLFLPFDSLVPLYVVSVLFGLFQGGIVPSYAIIVREHFPAAEAGARVGTVIMFTFVGMALGGWLSGKVFDISGSYHAAFLNGIAWNLLNFAIASMLLLRGRRPRHEEPSVI
jgi:MFS family permease